MPQIPTYESSASILGRGMPMQEASASAFGYMEGQAIEQAGQGLERTAMVISSIDQRRKSLDAEKYVNDSMAQLRDHYTKRMADPAFNSTEGFAEDLHSEMEKTMTDYEAKAPNKLAREQFRNQFQDFTSSRYAAATAQSAQTQATNLLLSIDKQNNSVTSNYENDRLTPKLDANTELIKNITTQFTNIDRAIGDINPAKALQLKSELIVNSVYATMNYSPSTARKILNMGELDAKTKHSLERQIETAETSAKTLDVSALKKSVQNRIDFAKSNGQPAKLSLSDTHGIIPDEQGTVLVNEANDLIDIYNTGNQHLTKIRPWNANAQKQFIADLEGAIGKDQSTATKNTHITRFVAEQSAANIRWAEKDFAGYMMENNPAANAMSKHLDTLRTRDMSVAGNKEAYAAKAAELDTFLLELQSGAPAGVTGDAAKQYTLANRSQLKTLSNSQAAAYIRQINESSPKEAVSSIRSVLAQHPSHPEIAFNNLVMPSDGTGIRGDYWLLYMNADNPDAADLAGSIAKAAAAGQLSVDDTQKYEDAFNGYTPWRQFEALFPNDNYQMAGTLSGIKNGVLANARMLSLTKGQSVEQSIQVSVDKWIFGKMTIASVNGQPVLLDREKAKGPPMSDQEADEFGRSLSGLQQYLDPRIDEVETHFPTIWGPNGPGNEMLKWEETRRAINNRGYFKPATGLDYSTLYLRSDTGTDFEARSGGKAIAIKNDEVPSYYHEIVDRETGLTYSLENKPSAEPLTTEGWTQHEAKGDWTSGPLTPRYREHGIISTNWPVDPKWIRKMNPR